MPAQDPGFAYPLGFVGFSMNGCQVGGSATVTAVFTGTYDPADITIRKYNSNTHSFSTVTEASKTATTLGGHPALVVSYTITDGGSLDQDGVANGTIVDPVGLGVKPAAASALAKTGQSTSSIVILAATSISLGLGLVVVRRRQLQA